MKKQSISRLLVQLFAVAMLGASLGACAPTPTRRDVPEFADDAVLTTRVKAALAKESISDAADIQVETYRGVVQLSGFADSPEAMQKALNAANGVDGVKSVKNDVRIKSSR
ncbi:MAG: hypothetical protein JWL63_3351 [Rhodocyclales bacterium]|nr:hypothetical protein [Rhodocyclales bacterium]